MGDDLMDSRNITLALPRELVRQAKVMAAERGTSISALVADLLAGQVRRHRGLRAARARHRALTRAARDLGTGGRITWSREDLHER
jgi:hypothetical protein